MNTVTVLSAFLRRGWQVNRSYRFAFALEFVSAIISVCMFFFVGRFIDRAGLSEHSSMQHGYFPYVLVGTFLMSIVRGSIFMLQATISGSQVTGTLEALLATPSSSAFLIVCNAMYDFAKLIALELYVLLFAALFLNVPIRISPISVGGAAIALVGSTTFFGAIGLVLAGLTLVIKRGVAQPAQFMISGMTLIGGIYYPTIVLPTPLRHIADCLPLTWAVNIMRSALLNGELETVQIILLVVAGLIAAPVSLTFFGLMLNRARSQASLTHY